jgi:hypothetical protein
MISPLPHALPMSAPRHLPLLVVLALAVSLAIVGAVLAFGMLTTNDLGNLHHASAYVVGDAAPTSFGAVAVTDVQMLAGLSPEDLGGVTHGVQNLVTPENVQVELSVVLTNRGNRSIDYALTQQFRVLKESGDEVDRQPGLVNRPGKLAPHSSVTGTLRYVAPRDGGPLWLEYQDPGSARPVLIALGSTDQAPAGGPEGGSHNHSPAKEEAQLP